MNGILLLALGTAWDEARLPHPVKVTAYYTALYGTYGNWLNDLDSDGFRNRSGQPRQESVVAMGFLSVTIAIIATSLLAFWGFREPRRAVPGSTGCAILGGSH